MKQPAVELLSVDVDVMPLVISLCALRDVDGSYDEKLGLFENLLWKPESQAGKHALCIRCKEAAAALAGGKAFGGVREKPLVDHKHLVSIGHQPCESGPRRPGTHYGDVIHQIDSSPLIAKMKR
jgi:hypothetical protein